MSAIERVMKAYTSKHDLNAEQATLVREELSHFIDELLSKKRSRPETVKDGPHRVVGPRDQGSVSKNRPAPG